MTGKSRRLGVITFIAGLIGVAATLVLGALRDNIVFFHTPSEINQSGQQSGQHLRLGGLVKDGSVKIDGMQSVFIVTDGTSDITVRYNNALPNPLLFEFIGNFSRHVIFIMLCQHILCDKDVIFDLTLGDYTLSFTKQTWQGVVISHRNI